MDNFILILVFLQVDYKDMYIITVDGDLLINSGGKSDHLVTV